MTTLISPDTELILHVGAPKTGTSAVQRHFHAQADVLRRHGIHYPHHHLDANGVSGGHGDLLAQALAAGPIAGRQAIAQNLAAARRAECRLLLSAESAFLHPQAIVATLPTSRFHVICLARHPLDAVVSHHNQGVKRHRTKRPLRRLAAMILAAREPPRSLSGEPLFEWRACCGDERLTVLPYVVAGVPVDATAMLRELIGLPAEAPAGQVNRSYTPGAVELKRLVNHLPTKLLDAVDGEFDLRLQADADSRQEPRPTLTELLDVDTCAALDRVFRPTVDRLEAEFGICLGRDVARPTTTIDTAEAVWSRLADDPVFAARIRAVVTAARAAESASPTFRELSRIIAANHG